MIELKNVTKKLKGKMILDDISYTFEEGKIYGLVGVNGSGKSMLFRAISGLIRLDSGSVTIDGEVLRRDIDFPRSLGLLLENKNLIETLNAEGNLKLLAKISKRATSEDIAEAIEKVGLTGNDKIAKRYSLGMKQRLALAQAIFEKPEIILLDEPTNAIDEGGVNQIYEVIKEEKQRGATIIVTSHHREDIETLADEIIVIREGKI